jgi:hypothetical protein
MFISNRFRFGVVDNLKLCTGVHVRDLREEVPDGQDVGGSPQSRPSQPEAVLLQALRLQGRTKGLSHRSQSFRARYNQTFII